MRKHGFRSVFSLLLALMMVCSVLPTAAFAEGDVEPVDQVAEQTDEQPTPEQLDVEPLGQVEQPKPVVVDEPSPQVMYDSVPINLTVTSYGAPFISGSTGEHTVNYIDITEYVTRSNVGSDNASGSATGRFVGSNETGWTLVVDLVVGNYTKTITTNARVTNKDMSNATGYITFGASFNTAGGIHTTVRISGAKDLPKPPQPDNPGTPTADDIVNNNILGDVTIECTNGNVQHGSKSYPLTKDSITSITESTYDSNAGYFSCMVTVSSTGYVHQFDKDKGGVHTPDNKTKTIQLLYYSNAWHGPSGDPSVASIIFKVACNEKPKAPDAPDVNDLLKDKWVGITCEYVPTHQRGFKWVNDSYAIKEEGVVSDGKGGYTYTVTILPNAYIAACNAWIPNMPHTLVSPESVDVTLTWNKGTESWEAPEEDVIAMFTVTCKKTETPPPAPSHDDLSKLIGDITVNCTNNAATHEPKSKGYALISDSYTTSGVVGDAENGYTYTVTISPEKYVEQFGTDTKVTHTTEDGNATVVLKYGENGWAVESGTPVAFNVSCKTETVPPQKPTDKDLEDLNVPPVDVICETKGQPHSASYVLFKDSYVIGEVTSDGNGGYTCDITVHAEKYVAKSNYEYGVHTLADGESNTKTLTLKYEGGKWGTGLEHVTFKIKCVDFAPTKADLDGIRVFVKCTNSSATHGDKEKEYKLIDGYYNVKTPTFDKDDHVYHCVVEVNGDDYVEKKYYADVGVAHTHISVDTGVKYAYLIATWTDNGYVWSLDEDWGYIVELEARCEAVPVQKYTVTYTDGVDGVEIFKDQVYSDLTAGTATPAFNGTPSRVGYVFAGWNPAVSATVTGDATYTATWKVDSNNNGKPDDEEERYTVTYTDGAGGKAFADQVYPGLLSGTATPKFNGSPVRAGYYFTGWSPKLSATVTGNVTYTATWTKAYGGLDNVPKTGDNGLTLALSALLLFSFCGATACVVSTKKRG